MYVHEVETNTGVDTYDVEVQTDQYLKAVGGEDLKVDEEKLGSWLASIYPKVAQVLESNLKSDAFTSKLTLSHTNDHI